MVGTGPPAVPLGRCGLIGDHPSGSLLTGSLLDGVGQLVRFSKGSGAGFAIFVMSRNGIFYSGSHNVGIFHHSSFFSGGDVRSAGEMKVESGKLTALTNKSGHYKPDRQQLEDAAAELRREGVDMTYVAGTFFDMFGQKFPVDIRGPKGYS